MRNFLKTLLSAIFSFFAIGLVNAHYEETALFGPTSEDWNDLYNELGALPVSVQNAVKAKISAVKAKADNQKLLVGKVDKGQAYLMAKTKDLPVSMQKRLANNQLVYSDVSLYHTWFGITTAIAGINQVIQSGAQVGTGYSSFKEGGIVPKDIAMACDYIEFSFSTYTIANGVFSKSFIGAKESETRFEGSDLEIVVNGIVVRTIPVQAFTESRYFRNGFAPIDVVNSANYGFNLQNPIFIKEDDVLQYNLKMANGISVPAPAAGSAYAMRVKLLGSSLTNRQV